MRGDVVDGFPAAGKADFAAIDGSADGRFEAALTVRFLPDDGRTHERAKLVIPQTIEAPLL